MSINRVGAWLKVRFATDRTIVEILVTKPTVLVVRHSSVANLVIAFPTSLDAIMTQIVQMPRTKWVVHREIAVEVV